MRRVLGITAAICLAATPAALATKSKTLSYQGYTSQGHEIRFKKSKKGVMRMSITVRAGCTNASGQNQGDYDFTLKATDSNADAVTRGRFKTVLPGKDEVPSATISGKFNKRGVARGTIRASGPAKGPDGEDLGTCKSPTVRWTAGP
jgi:hypothetical protein